MPNLNTINSILNLLEKDDEQFLSVLDRFIKFNIMIADNSEEIREELSLLNKIYQFVIYEGDKTLLSFWIERNNDKILYQQGINPKAQVHFKLSKTTLIKAIKREINLSDYFMKGLIEIDGDIYEIIKLRNILRDLYAHVLKKYPIK